MRPPRFWAVGWVFVLLAFAIPGQATPRERSGNRRSSPSITIYPTGEYPTDAETFRQALDDGYATITMAARDLSGEFKEWHFGGPPKIGDFGDPGNDWQKQVAATPLAFPLIEHDVTIQGELLDVSDEDGDQLRTTLNGCSMLIGLPRSTGIFTAKKDRRPVTATVKDIAFRNSTEASVMSWGRELTVDNCKFKDIYPAFDRAVGDWAAWAVGMSNYIPTIDSPPTVLSLDSTYDRSKTTEDPWIVRDYGFEQTKLTVTRCIIDMKLPLGRGTYLYDLIDEEGNRRPGLGHDAGIFVPHSKAGCYIAHNTISNGVGGILLADTAEYYGEESGRTAIIEYNDIAVDDDPNTWGGIALNPRVLYGALSVPLPTYVRHNTVRVVGEVNDWISCISSDNGSNLTVENNTLEANGRPAMTVHLGTSWVEDAWLWLSGAWDDPVRFAAWESFRAGRADVTGIVDRSNILRGRAGIGYYVGAEPAPWEHPASMVGAVFDKNNFAQLALDVQPDLPRGISYFLAEGTRDCTVVVRPKELSTVIDEGTGNTFTNTLRGRGQLLNQPGRNLRSRAPSFLTEAQVQGARVEAQRSGLGR